MTSNTDTVSDERLAEIGARLIEGYRRSKMNADADFWEGILASRASSASGEPVASLRKSGQEFLEAAEAVFDWMNGNDLSADHEEQKPDDFERVSKALVEFRAALSSDNPDTTPGGKA